MLLQLGSIPTLVVSSADMAREIFKTRDLAFSGRPVLYAAKKFSYNCSSVSFAPYGEYWRELRKIAVLELLSAKRVQGFEVIRDKEVNSMVDSIAHSINPINLSELTLLLANNVICQVAFGKKNSSDGKDKRKSKFHEILNETQHLLGGFCVADFFPWMGWLNKFNGIGSMVEKNFKELDKYYDQMIEEHLDTNRPKLEHEDFVDVLLRLQKDPQLKKLLLEMNTSRVSLQYDMFIAGTDTSSAILVWTMTELIKNPSVMKKSQDEVRSVAKEKPKVEESDLSKLTYLKMVIKEGLRLHRRVPLLAPRETTERCTVGGYKIPSKTRVLVNVKVIGMDLAYWENPRRRSCPGINFAVPLIELALANLLHRFNWALPEGMREEDVDMDEAFGLTMHKKIPLCLIAPPANI
ncbi:hypothetical protein ACSBR2_023823 [Camellia fascicularis]